MTWNKIKQNQTQNCNYGKHVVIAWELLLVATTILNCGSWFWVMEVLAEVRDLFDILVQLDQVVMSSMI